MKNLLCLFLLILLSQCRPKEVNTPVQSPGKPAAVPSAIKETHRFLLEKMHKLTLNKDGSSSVALKLEELMQHHFKEEEDFILPPLGLLPTLANEQLPKQTNEMIALSENVRSMLDHMNVEHQLIKAYIGELKQASSVENRPEVIEFEKEVIKHATIEEEVFFPASILIGKYLTLKSKVKL